MCSTSMQGDSMAKGLDSCQVGSNFQFVWTALPVAITFRTRETKRACVATPACAWASRRLRLEATRQSMRCLHGQFYQRLTSYRLSIASILRFTTPPSKKPKLTIITTMTSILTSAREALCIPSRGSEAMPKSFIIKLRQVKLEMWIL